VEQLWGLIDEKEPLLWLEDGQYLVWDAHFGNNEGKTPLDNVLHKQNVKMLKRFYPEEQGPQYLAVTTTRFLFSENKAVGKTQSLKLFPIQRQRLLY
jgi:hypothetical protein